MTNYSFRLTITYTAIGWQVEIQDLAHNHGAFIHTAALPYYRQRTKETKKTITNMSANSIAPNKILINLLKKDIIISLKDIYNKRQLNKKLLLSGLSPTSGFCWRQ